MRDDPEDIRAEAEARYEMATEKLQGALKKEMEGQAGESKVRSQL
jgi:hypothetical protein